MTELFQSTCRRASFLFQNRYLKLVDTLLSNARHLFLTRDFLSEVVLTSPIIKSVTGSGILIKPSQFCSFSAWNSCFRSPDSSWLLVDCSWLIDCSGFAWSWSALYISGNLSFHQGLIWKTFRKVVRVHCLFGNRAYADYFESRP